MLVLTRKVGERIVIPGLEVEVFVLKIVGNRVSVGVDAPAESQILRGEIVDRQQPRENAA